MKTTNSEILSLLADAEAQLLDEIRQTLKNPRALRFLLGRSATLTQKDQKSLDRVVKCHVEEFIFNGACFGDFYPGVAIRLSESLNTTIRRDINPAALAIFTEVSDTIWESEIRDSIDSWTDQRIDEVAYKSACINSLHLKSILIERLAAAIQTELPPSTTPNCSCGTFGDSQQ